uniref:Putative LOC100680322 [Nasonia vitripennis] n=1 Tax=Lepeophtheirus salmonis TaxID=72036 RepID=A0A0K2TLQ9_LEPSM
MTTFPVLITPADFRGSSDEDENNDEDTSSVNSPPTKTSSNRPSCAYGTSCYRRNPQHRIDEAHPGDSDYNDVRPECNFGIDCIRKNSRHKIEYQHTRKMRPTRKLKAQFKCPSDSNSDEDLSLSDDDDNEWIPSDD